MTTDTSTRSVTKIALAAAAGASIEWYDFFVYGTAAALVFPQLFFPHTLSPYVAQLAAFSTFAVGFLARPVGGALFGHVGDRFGRKTALFIALISMGAASVLIGVLPGYAALGDLAPVLLVLLRFVQGLAVGGQWGGAVLIAVENAPGARRGYYGSFAQIGVPVGLVLANAVYYIVGAWLAPHAFATWGWRLPFLFSLAIVGVGIYVQFRLEETVEFSTATAKQAQTAAPRSRSPILEVVLAHPREILLAGGTFLANNICFYVAITYAIAYGTATLHLPKLVMISAVMIGSLAMIPALMIAGWVSDRWGRIGIFMTGAALAGLWAFAFFPLIDTRSSLLVTFSVCVELVLLSVMYGPQAALFAELFPVKVRYSGASLGYQVGAVVGGGFAPIIAATLLERFATTFSIALYMSVACAISFVSTFLLSNARRQSS
ncbi:MAG: MHS family MFS transporter [Alphaproteobacteria bacterium]|nr:MHS family MFS transporter [Alphaproteobacteria bacterium]